MNKPNDGKEQQSHWYMFWALMSYLFMLGPAINFAFGLGSLVSGAELPTKFSGIPPAMLVVISLYIISTHLLATSAIWMSIKHRLPCEITPVHARIKTLARLFIFSYLPVLIFAICMAEPMIVGVTVFVMGYLLNFISRCEQAKKNTATAAYFLA